MNSSEFYLLDDCSNTTSNVTICIDLVLLNVILFYVMVHFVAIIPI